MFFGGKPAPARHMPATGGPVGAGSAVGEWLAAHGCTAKILNLGLPDQFIDQGDYMALYAAHGLDEKSIASTISTFVA